MLETNCCYKHDTITNEMKSYFSDISHDKVGVDFIDNVLFSMQTRLVILVIYIYLNICPIIYPIENVKSPPSIVLPHF